MWGSGAARRRRHLALSAMVDAAGHRGDYVAPWRHAPEIWQHFPDESAILQELQRDWRTALAGAIYVAIEEGDGDLQADVARAYAAIERRYRGVRKVLEAHADHPAIAQAMRKERALLSSLVTLGAPLVTAA